MHNVILNHINIWEEMMESLIEKINNGQILSRRETPYAIFLQTTNTIWYMQIINYKFQLVDASGQKLND